jgi:general secretion pathway protein A
VDKLYSDYFNLPRNPFGETPDASFYFDSKTHNSALNKLGWAVEQGRGFTLLTGEVGTGKTLISRMLLNEISETASTALILYPKLNDLELLAAIAAEFEIECEASTNKQYLDCINEFLLRNAAEGRKSVLIIDEAQNLPTETLETVRLLSNLETEREKLLQIILVAQPELRAELDTPKLRQLRQRICVSLNLEPFTQEDTERYIKHRFEVAGSGNFVRFDQDTMRLIHKRSGGIPRKINKLCEFILLSAQKRQSRLISLKLATEILAGPRDRRSFFERLTGSSPRPSRSSEVWDP